jgi:hypothetical protein
MNYGCFVYILKGKILLLPMRAIFRFTKNPHDVNATTVSFSGDTAFAAYAADGKSSPEMVKLLLDKGVNANAKNNLGHQPLSMCAKWALTDPAILLLDVCKPSADSMQDYELLLGAKHISGLLYSRTTEENVASKKEFVQSMVSWFRNPERVAEIQASLDKIVSALDLFG